jgi:hypothetical protein
MADNSMTDDVLDAEVVIPDPDTIRRQLAVLVTRVDLLKAQLRVSVRAEQEQERLRRQGLDDRGVVRGGAA